VDADQALALMVLVETLSSVKTSVLRKIDFVSTGWCGDTSKGWGTSKAAIDKMTLEGWCPRTIKLLQSQSTYNVTAPFGIRTP
jgi:hypothetical protein